MANMAHRAARQKRYRQRQRRGLAVYRVPAGERVLLALVQAGRLSDAETLDRARVEEEMAALLRDWAGRWQL